MTSHPRHLLVASLGSVLLKNLEFRGFIFQARISLLHMSFPFCTK